MALDHHQNAPTQILEQPYCEDLGSGDEDCVTDDDSDEDPTYDVLQDTCSKLSNLSLKRSNSRASMVTIDSARKLELDEEEIEEIEEAPGLDEKDKKCFEKVDEIVKAGGLERLTVDQCKVYLRKHGLRLTGKKEVLVERIREHISVIDERGEEKYPIASFVLNCKGDACNGDVVLFEQKVYEMYNPASRSSTAPPVGTRMVAGRIVKESYGAAKQQHTFTIEVLWSKGIKPLPPLHPLLIKGRNLYRLKTMRQRWADEEERNKVLREKHSRGFVARSNRETRIQEKEMRKRFNEPRDARKENNFKNLNRLPKPNPNPNPESCISTPQLSKDSIAPPEFIKLPNSKFPSQNPLVLAPSVAVDGENNRSIGVLNRQALAIVKCSSNLATDHVATKESERRFSSEQHAHGKLGKQQILVRCSPPRRPLTEAQYHAQEYSSSSMHQGAANNHLDKRPLIRLTSPSKRPYSGGYSHSQQPYGHSSSPMRHRVDNDNLDRRPLSRVTSPSKRPFSGGYTQAQQPYGHSSRVISPSRRPFSGGYLHTQHLNGHSSSPMHHRVDYEKLDREPLSRFSSPSRRPFPGGYTHSQQPYGYSSSQMHYGAADDKLNRFTSPSRRPYSGGSTHSQQPYGYSSSQMHYGAADDKLGRQELSRFASPSRRPLSGGPIQRKVCDYYVQRRLCPYEDNCKYLHEFPENRVDARTGRHTTKELCRYYLHGRCQYGGSCNFVHER
ncbi:hypothetical protein Syun_011535 [Stephania yunnanensis]|uniref:Zinc finger CCCH domain-containing protein 62-like n=1 Tax=Stephania yunnanensis TaxID=152371 RepID=A0AAP0PI80_9MAGN